MYNLILCELLKFKRSRIMWALLGTAIVPSVVNNWTVEMSGRHPDLSLFEVWIRNNELVLNFLIAQLVVAILTGFVVTREYRDRTINTMYTYPYRRSEFYLAKLIVLFLLILSFFLLAYLSSIVNAAMFLGLSGLTFDLFWHHLQIYLLMAGMHLALVPIAYAVCLIGKTLAASALLGFTLAVASAWVVNGAWENMYPWTIPTLLTFLLLGEGAEVNVYDPYPSLYVLLVVFVVPFLFNLFYQDRADVHSGS